MPKATSSPSGKSTHPYTVTKAQKRSLLAKSGQATLENITRLQQTGMKKHGKAEITTKKYDQVIAAARKWLAMSLGGKTAEGKKGRAKSTAAEPDSDSDSEDEDEDFEDGPAGPDPMAPEM